MHGARLLEESNGARENVFENLCRKDVHFSTAACPHIENAGLIAPHYSCGADSRDGHSKTSPAGKVTAAGDGQHDRQLRDVVEFSRRNDQNRPAALLFVSRSGIEGHKIDIPAVHSSSPPAAGASIHSRSAAGCGCE